MSLRIISPAEVRRYLLGEASDTVRLEIEERIAADAAFAEALDLAESQLIDDFVFRQLSEVEVVAFETKFLTNEDRRERLAMAKGVAAMSARSRQRRWMTASAAVAVICLLLFLLFSKRDREGALRTIALMPNSNRSLGMEAEIHLGSAASIIVLELHCSEFPPAHIATLTRIGELSPLLTMQMAKPNTLVVKLPISKANLTAGDYLVVLSAEKSFRADFVFRVQP